RAGVEEVAGNLKMSGCLRDHADGVNRTEQLAVVGHRAHRKLASDLIARLLPRVRHRYELAIGGLRVFLGVKAAEVADSDDCCSDFFHHAGIMPRPGAGLAPSLTAAAAADQGARPCWLCSRLPATPSPPHPACA